MSKTKILFRLIGYTAKYKGKIFLLVLLGVLSVGFSVLTPLPIKYVVDNVLSGKPLSPGILTFFNQYWHVPNKFELLIVLVSISALLVIASALLNLLSGHMTTKICQHLVFDFSTSVFEKLQRLSLSFYSKSNVGELMQRVTGDTYVIYSIVGGILLPILLSLASLAAMFYVMATINLQLALIAISVVPIFALLLVIFNKPITASITAQTGVYGDLWAFTQQSLSSVKIIQAYSREDFTTKKYRDHNMVYNDASVAMTKISLLYYMLISIVSGIVGAVIVYIGAFKGLNGTISIGELFVFLGYMGALFGPVNSLASTVTTAFTIIARARRIFEIMDSEEEVKEAPNAIELTNVKGNIKLNNVEFGYGSPKDSHAVLKNFNVKIEAGQMVALVGPTGAGKTSLISLLLRFYDPWKGQIFLDDKNINEVTLKSLRNHITLVLQDSFIFPMSIHENIAFGNPSATESDIISAAKAAQAHDFIMRSPEGYDTIVSEGGTSLSGGEKQRISLARAFLRNTPILILDEPTSAMDVQTEAKIFEALSTFAKGRTVFIISHRLSTIRHADIIITIKDGTISEIGTHETLIKDNKLYAELQKLHHAPVN